MGEQESKDGKIAKIEPIVFGQEEVGFIVPRQKNLNPYWLYFFASRIEGIYVLIKPNHTAVFYTESSTAEAKEKAKKTITEILHIK